MRRISILFLISVSCAGKTACAQEVPSDAEQARLQLCYHFSRLLECNIDSLSNTLFYQTIYDWLGTPYKYSGDCKEGVDCSGFACMLYKEVYGIQLAQSSADIYSQVKPLKKSALKEGDLVFFKIKQRRISHVGVYIGNNKFVHASVQSGVIISDLEEPYYKKYFFKGGRVKR